MRAEKERERVRELLNTTDMAQHTRIRKELNFGQSDAKNLPFTSVTSIFVTYIPIRIGCVLLVELKALLIMHKINRKRWIQNEKNDERKSLARSFVRDNTHTHTQCIHRIYRKTTRKMLSSAPCSHSYVDKTWNKSKSTALGRIFHLTVTKSTKHLYSFKPNKFFVSSHIHVA